MIFLNEIEKEESITKADLRVLIHLLNPIAPHMTEEINENCKLGDMLAISPWPTYEEEKTVEDSYELVVQVNGKVRGKITVSTNTTEEEMKEHAKSIENVKTYLDGHEVVKMIVIPKKLVNIVIK